MQPQSEKGKDINEDYIDLLDYLSCILRNYKIFTFSFLIIISFGIYKILNWKPLWQGQFQIVLSSRNKFLPSNESQNLRSILQSNNKDIKTEIKILESPAILTPVFKNYKKYLAEQNINVDKLIFNQFSNDINVEQEENTSILTVSYKNSNKNIILPIVKDISNQYQNYSQRDEKYNNQKTLTYLEDQIKIYKLKSKNSLTKAQNYAIEHNLTPLTGEGEIDKEIQLVASDPAASEISDTIILKIEQERVNAANQIEKILSKKLLLEEIQDNEEFYAITRTDDNLAKLPVSKNIDELTLEINYLKSIFTENDQKLKSAIKDRNIFLKEFRRQALANLDAGLIDSQAIVDSSERPQGVLVTYKELLRQSYRDIFSLRELETNFQKISIQKSIIKDPWELILQPTILPYPVGLSKRQILFNWILISILGSALICILKDQIIGNIHSKNRLVKILPFQISAILDKKLLENWQNDINFKILRENLKNFKKINIIVLGEVNIDFINKISSLINEKGLPKVEICNNLGIWGKDNYCLLVVERGKIKKDNINKLNQDIEISQLFIDSWILVN